MTAGPARNHIAEIEQLKYRYLRAIDTKSWDDLADTVTDDVVGDYGEAGHEGGNLRFKTRETLVDFMRTSLGDSILTEHRVNHPVITVDGESATGSWYLQDRVFMFESNTMLTGAAFYDDRYRLTSGGWKVCATGYRRTYEATVSLDDLPSMNIRYGALINRS